MGTMHSIECIEKANKCMRCGLCVSICPVSAISLQYKRDGFYHPVVNSNCIGCGKCIKSCPAEINDLNTLPIGKYKKILLAHAGDSHARRQSTSGGGINALIRYVLDTNYVDCVLMVKKDQNSIIESSYTIVTQDDSPFLKKSPRNYASRYVSVPVLEGLKDALLRYKRIAVVGTPCQIRAVTLLNNKKIVLKIGVACSSGVSYLATQNYKERMHAGQADFYYRGNGWPGFNSLVENGNVVEFEHRGSMFETMFSSQIFKNAGCIHCHDQFAEEADISFSDFWHAKEIASEKIGNSCFVIRNSESLKLVDSMIASGYIEVVRTLLESEIMESQGFVVKIKKGGLTSRLDYKVFVTLCKIVRSTGIYKIFNYKLFKKFSRIHYKLIRKTD